MGIEITIVVGVNNLQNIQGMKLIFAFKVSKIFCRLRKSLKIEENVLRF